MSRKKRHTAVTSPSSRDASEQRSEERSPLPPPSGGKGDLVAPAKPESSSAKPSPEDQSSGGRDERRLLGTAAAPRVGGRRNDQRLSARRKREVITRLLRGETLDALARELGVTAATIAEWRDTFLAAGEAALKTRTPTAQDAEVRQLKETLGDVTMRLELAREANRRLGLNYPFDSRRSRT